MLVTNILGTIDKRLENIRKEMALFDKFLWDVFNYWFVQYDFPNVEGKPYKTNGGIFERSSELKQMIPKNWQCGNLYQIADFINGLACQKYRPKNGEFLPVIKIKEMHNGITNSTEKADRNVPEIYKIESGDILFSWSATLEIMYWFGGKGVLNQHIFKVVPKNIVMTDFAYRQIFKYITVFKKIAETRKTTMGHITSDHIKQSCIVIPPLEILTEYSNYIKPFIEKISKLNQELLQILSLKNTVLPLLMNGQIAVQ